jgi:hypothetical protein
MEQYIKLCSRVVLPGWNSPSHPSPVDSYYVYYGSYGILGPGGPRGVGVDDGGHQDSNLTVQDPGLMRPRIPQPRISDQGSMGWGPLNRNLTVQGRGCA